MKQYFEKRLFLSLTPESLKNVQKAANLGVFESGLIYSTDFLNFII